jgi:selenocysteine-specific elongation factor
MRTLFVVGTAGHIDHGKSALVKALTGIDPDRLEEEQRRGMTIDLGFAHFDLPSGRRVGIVDVPGHERFIKNMLAGATGIDLVLLVIAADEGVMPQTREHVDILRFLSVRQGIIVLNKVDLVTDPSWLVLVKDDVRALVAGTPLEAAPIVEVSAKTGQGIPVLVETMDRMLTDVIARDTSVPARLPIDRVFVIAGFGLIVTGTLWSGRIAPGDTLEVLPKGRKVRVRGVQSHGQAVSEGVAGSRVAVNLVGIEKDEVARGDTLCSPGSFRPSDLIDVRIRLLPSAPPVPHRARIRLHLGSDEAIGRLMLLDRSRVDPGNEAVAQIRLDGSVVAAAGDLFVIRQYSPMITIGGGEVIDAHPPTRRRSAASVAVIQEISAAGIPQRVEAAVQAAGRRGATVEDLAKDLSVGRTQVDAALLDLVQDSRLLLERGRLYHRRVADELAAVILREVDAHHALAPWRLGIPREELKGKAFGTGDDRFYAHLLSELISSGKVEEIRDFVRRPGFSPPMDIKAAEMRAQIVRILQEGRFTPPGAGEIAKKVGNSGAFDRVFRALQDEGEVVEVGSGIFFHREALEEIKQTVVDEIKRHGNISVATLRDSLGTSRKYALTVLEYFDSVKLTRRIGDARVLVARA